MNCRLWERTAVKLNHFNCIIWLRKPPNKNHTKDMTHRQKTAPIEKFISPPWPDGNNDNLKYVNRKRKIVIFLLSLRSTQGVRIKIKLRILRGRFDIIFIIIEMNQNWGAAGIKKDDGSPKYESVTRKTTHYISRCIVTLHYRIGKFPSKFSLR